MRTTGRDWRSQRSEYQSMRRDATSQAGFSTAITRQDAPRAAIGRRIAPPTNRGPRVGQGSVMTRDSIRRRLKLNKMYSQSRRE